MGRRRPGQGFPLLRGARLSFFAGCVYSLIDALASRHHLRVAEESAPPCFRRCAPAAVFADPKAMMAGGPWEYLCARGGGPFEDTPSR